MGKAKPTFKRPSINLDETKRAWQDDVPISRISPGDIVVDRGLVTESGPVNEMGWQVSFSSGRVLYATSPNYPIRAFTKEA